MGGGGGGRGGVPFPAISIVGRECCLCRTFITFKISDLQNIARPNNSPKIILTNKNF